MGAHVRRQRAERHPPAIEVARRAIHEPTDVVAPEGEAREAERQTAAQLGGHRRVGVLGVTAPVERISLATGPRAAAPDDAVAGDVLRELPDRVVVAHRIEVVLVPAGAAVGIDALERRAFTEVGLDDTDAHAKQRRELAAIPLHGLRIGEVEHGVLGGEAAALVLHGEVSGDELLPQRVLRGEVRVLPEADVEAVILQVGDHLRRIGEARLRELVVAPPIGFEPAGIEVQDVGRHLVLAELRGDVAHFGFRLVGDAAHPEPERPERGDRTASGDRRVLRDDVLRLAEEDEDVDQLVPTVDRVMRVVLGADVERDGCARVHEHAVPAAADEKRHGLVLKPSLRTHGVAEVGEHALAALVQPRERLTESVDALVGCELEGRGGAAAEVARTPHEREGRVGEERRRIGEMRRAREELARRVIDRDVPWVATDHDSAEGTRVRDRAVAVRHAPGAIHRDRAGEHERRLALHRRRREIARAEAQAHGARRDERDLEREDRVAVVFRARKLRRWCARVDDVRLLERVTRGEGVAIPLERAAAGGGVECREPVGDEDRLERFSEVVAGVDHVAELAVALLCAGERGQGGGDEQAEKKREPGARA